MVRKLLFTFLLLNSLLVFSQEKTIEGLTTSPNPFIYSTQITFYATQKQEVFVTVKNILGRSVYNKLITTEIGKNTLPFERGNLKSGIYIYAIITPKETHSKRFVIR